MTTDPYPFAASQAAQMLDEAIRKHTAEKSGGLRALARVLGINQAAVLSHMATGRIGIPPERVTQFATVLGMDAVEFGMAVIDQRFPSLSKTLWQALHDGRLVSDERLRRALEVIDPAEQRFAERVAVIAEAARDTNPSERWLKLEELPMMREIRARRPDGLGSADARLMLDLLDLVDKAGSELN